MSNKGEKVNNKTQKSGRYSLSVGLNEKENIIVETLRKKHYINISRVIKECLKNLFDKLERQNG